MEIQTILTKLLSGTIYMEEALGLLSRQGGKNMEFCFKKLFYSGHTDLHIGEFPISSINGGGENS